MTDEHYKACTQKIKALADIRQIGLDDVDSIIHAYYKGLKAGEPLDSVEHVLSHMSDEARQAFTTPAEKGAKRALQDGADQDGKKAKVEA
jgi:homocitrate synthase